MLVTDGSPEYTALNTGKQEECQCLYNYTLVPVITVAVSSIVQTVLLLLTIQHLLLLYSGESNNYKTMHKNTCIKNIIIL